MAAAPVADDPAATALGRVRWLWPGAPAPEEASPDGRALRWRAGGVVAYLRSDAGPLGAGAVYDLVAHRGGARDVWRYRALGAAVARLRAVLEGPAPLVRPAGGGELRPAVGRSGPG